MCSDHHTGTTTHYMFEISFSLNVFVLILDFALRDYDAMAFTTDHIKRYEEHYWTNALDSKHHW